MKNLRKTIIACSVPMLLVGGCVSVSSMTPGKMEWVQADSDAPRAGNAYLTRGLIGLFSHGIDVLTDEVSQSGVRAHVFQEDQKELLAAKIVETYKNDPNHEPIVLIGHSLGADDSIMIARELDKVNVPVDLLITLDATRPPKVPKNVKLCYNYYQPSIFDGTGILRGIPLETEPDFHGRLVNMNVRAEYKDLLEWDTNHVNIDKNSKIHKDIIAKLHTVLPTRQQWAAAHPMRGLTGAQPAAARLVPTSQPVQRQANVPLPARTVDTVAQQ
ncbi:MAG TPA: hypothetical protein VHD56_07340 [Tepidisphaeraceae bacterium]|nr:hypothetical protein [Tepidisphaeraceae bacterium]